MKFISLTTLSLATLACVQAIPVSLASNGTSSGNSTSSSFPAGNDTVTAWGKKQVPISVGQMLNNINTPGSASGFLAASLSTSSPDYFYAWSRLVLEKKNHVAFRVLLDQAVNGNTDEKLLADLDSFLDFTKSSQTVNLGEPKFNPDGSVFSGPWGRPQNDGPAERATTLILYDQFKKGTDAKDYIYKDLDYVVENWKNQCFDLWEEVQGVHFFTLMVMRRGLLDGADYATANGDSDKASSYKSVVSDIEDQINQFWNGQVIQVTLNQNIKQGGLDTSVLIAALVGARGDGFYTAGNDKILATSVQIEAAMKDQYTLNKNLPDGLGTAIGRYPNDVYDGVGTSQGNPWFICTNTFAELYYTAIAEWNDAGNVTVTNTSLPFFSQFDDSAKEGTSYAVGSDEYTKLIDSIALAADKFLSTTANFENTNGSISEQYNRDSGKLQGARDLTWSHASTISAIGAKNGKPAI
ncbi:glucoamylase [Gongronella butleri]|nr:glucoamylase [Gongronella butleri]